MDSSACADGVEFTMRRQDGRVTEVHTTSPAVDHFLRLVNVRDSYHTWVNYAFDLRSFFAVVGKPPEALTRTDCVAFMEQQARRGLADATINRRLAAVSSLLTELQLYDPDHFARNLVRPAPRGRNGRRAVSSLYHRQPARIPHILPPADLRAIFVALPSWRDRTLMLLMWVSCLRVSEVVALRFADIECSQRRVQVRAGKGGWPRTTYMDEATFGALNRYLDQERGALFPEQDALFVSFKGRARGWPLTPNAIQKMLTYYGRTCGVPDLHPHLFRHTGITQLLEHKVPAPVVRALVGHRRPESLDPYTHLSDPFLHAEFTRAQDALDLTRLLHLADAARPTARPAGDDR